jgi:hypothetical protein
MTPNKGGRKPLPEAERKLAVTIFMSPADLADLERLGCGNRQEGFRELMRLWKRRKPNESAQKQTA